MKFNFKIPYQVKVNIQRIESELTTETGEAKSEPWILGAPTEFFFQRESFL